MFLVNKLTYFFIFFIIIAGSNSKLLGKSIKQKNLIDTSFNMNQMNGNFSKQNILYKEHLILPETLSVKVTTILFLITFLTIYLVLNNYSFNHSNYSFVKKCLKMIFQQIFLYNFLIAILFILYNFQLLDFVKINWQSLIISLFIVGSIWMIFCLTVVAFSTNFIKNLRILEENSKNLKSLKQRYDTHLKSGKKGEYEIYLQSFEYNILKSYFIAPTYPVFKPSNLRKDFDFSLYIEYCLIKRFKDFLNIQWLTWISIIIGIIIWSMTTDKMKTKLKIWLLLLSPLYYIFISLLGYLYQQRIYRKVVNELDQNQFISFLDIQPYNIIKTKRKMIDFPIYIVESLECEIKANNSYSTLCKGCFDKSPPTMYENQIICGSSGLHVIIGVLQVMALSFVIWITFLVEREYILLLKIEGSFFLFIVIFILFFYIIAFPYMISNNLNILTIVSSIESKRNEKVIKKVVLRQLRNASKTAETIICNFKKIYYDIRNLEKKSELVESIFPLDYKEIGISKTCLKDFIDMNFRRFNYIQKYSYIKGTTHKVKTKLEEHPMIIQNLNQFLKTTTGCTFTETQFENMLHFLENECLFDLSKVTNKEIYEMLIANTFFSNYHPQIFILYVFDNYKRDITYIECPDQNGNYETRANEYPQTELYNTTMIMNFFNHYKVYFTEEQLKFIEEECALLEPEFSMDAFIYMLVSIRKYLPY